MACWTKVCALCCGCSFDPSDRWRLRVFVDSLFPNFVGDRVDVRVSNAAGDAASADAKVPAPPTGKALWPLYGVDPDNPFLLQREADKPSDRWDEVHGRRLRDLDTFVWSLFADLADDLSRSSVRLDMFHTISDGREGTEGATEGEVPPPSAWEEVQQPVRSFVALPRLYTDLYTRTKYPVRLKLNKPPRLEDCVGSDRVEGGGRSTEALVAMEDDGDEGDEDDEEVSSLAVAGARAGSGRTKWKTLSLKDPAVCLVCGRLLCAAQKVDKIPLELSDDISCVYEQHVPGECTLHSLECGSGVGVFYLVSSCQTLLCRAGRAIIAPSIYVDATGEAAQDRSAAGTVLSSGENRPMYLSEKRLRKLEDWYLSHVVAKEVTRKRQGERSVIRLNWF